MLDKKEIGVVTTILVYGVAVLVVIPTTPLAPNVGDGDGSDGESILEEVAQDKDRRYPRGYETV